MRTFAHGLAPSCRLAHASLSFAGRLKELQEDVEKQQENYAKENKAVQGMQSFGFCGRKLHTRAEYLTKIEEASSQVAELGVCKPSCFIR